MSNDTDFIRGLHSLCNLHGIEFVAVVGRDYEGVPVMYHHSWSIAVDHMKRREQAAQMHFDLVGLADQIRHEMWAPPEPDEGVGSVRVELN